MLEDPRYSAAIECGHCGNKGAMKVVASHSRRNDLYEDPLETRTDYELVECPVCDGVLLTEAEWIDMMEPDQYRPQVLYPSTRTSPIGLPTRIARAKLAADRVRQIDPNAYGLLIGRLLEEVCLDREAMGDNLFLSLEALAKKNEIPAKLLDVAHGLRALRNVGAHPSLGELTTNEVPVLDKLCDAILEYVYSAPHLAALAQARLEKVKRKHKE